MRGQRLEDTLFIQGTQNASYDLEIFQHFNIVKLAKDKMLECSLTYSSVLNSFNYLPAGELGKEGTLKPIESPSEAISSSFNLSSSLLITRTATASTQIISMRNLKEIRNH